MHDVSEDGRDRIIEILFLHLCLDADDIAYLANRILGVAEYEIRVAVLKERSRWLNPSNQ